MTLLVASRRGDQVVYISDIRSGSEGDFYDSFFKYTLINGDSKKLHFFVSGSINVWVEILKGIKAYFNGFFDEIKNTKDFECCMKNFFDKGPGRSFVTGKCDFFVVWQCNGFIGHFILKVGLCMETECKEFKDGFHSLGTGAEVFTKVQPNQIQSKAWNATQNNLSVVAENLMCEIRHIFDAGGEYGHYVEKQVSKVFIASLFDGDEVSHVKNYGIFCLKDLNVNYELEFDFVNKIVGYMNNITSEKCVIYFIETFYDVIDSGKISPRVINV